jgi:hypothetical protein
LTPQVLRPNTDYVKRPVQTGPYAQGENVVEPSRSAGNLL